MESGKKEKMRVEGQWMHPTYTLSDFPALQRNAQAYERGRRYCKEHLLGTWKSPLAFS
jgi:hypothetical protein